MSSRLLTLLGEQPLMRIVRGLLLNPEPLHIRELASRYALSPAGVSDIARRLKKAGVLKAVHIGNKRCLSLALSDDEKDCLRQFFKIASRSTLEKRASAFSKTAKEKLNWMDEAFEFYRTVKKNR